MNNENATHSQYGAKGQWLTELRIINDKLNMTIDIEAPQRSVSVVFSLRVVYVFRHLYVEEEEEEEEEEGGDSLFYK